VVRAVVVGVAVMVAPVVVMVLALVVMVLLVSGRVISAVAGNRHAATTDRHHACYRKCRCHPSQHLCLLEDEVSGCGLRPGAA
jgi:hypothetical protein